MITSTEPSLMSPESQQYLNTLVQALIPTSNYDQLLRKQEFWKAYESLEDVDMKTNLRKSIIQFFRCITCEKRLRRFADSGFVCYNCNFSSSGHEEKLASYPKYECLKCFKVYHEASFTNSNCMHLCGSCTHKEMIKGRNSCRICKIEIDNPKAGRQCNHCNDVKTLGELNEIRCGCVYCNSCFINVKRLGRCIRCKGINILSSEVYESNTRNMEICFLCEENKKIEMFTVKNCCCLDVCVDCQNKSTSETCAGCDRSEKNN